MKYANFWKRLGAYMIDFFLLLCLLWLVSLFIPENNNIKILNLEMNTIHELAIEHKISISGYIGRFADIIHDIDLEQVGYHLLNAFFILMYFTVLPYLWDGMTIGKKIFRIKIVRRDEDHLTMNDLLYRNVLVHGLAYLLGALLFVYLLPSFGYFLVVMILGFLQLGLVTVSGFMVLYRKDNQALHDILSSTNVIEIEK